MAKLEHPSSVSALRADPPRPGTLLRSVPAFAGLSSCHWHD